MAIHAHMESYQVDCDGPVARDWVMTIRDDEDDIDFHERVVSNVVSVYTILSKGRLEVSRFEDDSINLSWGEHTEEGFLNREATICKDETCDPTRKGQRDYYAEQMGY